MGVELGIALGVVVEAKRKPPVSRGCDEPSRAHYEQVVAEWSPVFARYGASREGSFARKSYWLIPILCDLLCPTAVVHSCSDFTLSVSRGCPTSGLPGGLSSASVT